MANVIPFSDKRLKEGPFSFPAPEKKDRSQLFKSLYKLLNYLAIEWCGGNATAHIRIAFDPIVNDQPFDLAIIIAHYDLQIKKHQLDEVFSECHVLHPFLQVSVTSPSLMVTGSISPFIKHYHKLWVTPRGVLTYQQPVLSREMSVSSVLYIYSDFKCDITNVKDLMYYFIVRLTIGCRDNLFIELKFDPVPHYHLHLPGQYKPGNTNPTKSDGSVHVKICKACQSCRIQTTKPKEILIRDHKFNVKMCTKQCFGSDNTACSDRMFKGKLTILGPGSVPVLHDSDEDFNSQLHDSDSDFSNQFSRLVNKWPCMHDKQTHLILIFECQVSKDNIHGVMEVLRETCFEVFSKYHSSFRNSVSQLTGRSPGSSSITVDLATASRNLARGISDIVERSKNSDFKDAVKKLLPYDSIEQLQESILNKSRQFGIKEQRIIDVRSGPSGLMTKIGSEPPAKRLKPSEPPEPNVNGVTIGDFCFTQTEEITQRTEPDYDNLSDFESLQ